MKEIKYAYSLLEDEITGELYETKEQCIKEAKSNTEEDDKVYIVTLEKTMFYPQIDEDRFFEHATEQYLENAYTERDWIDVADVDNSFIEHVNNSIRDYINKNCPKSYYWAVSDMEDLIRQPN